MNKRIICDCNVFLHDCIFKWIMLHWLGSDQLWSLCSPQRLIFAKLEENRFRNRFNQYSENYFRMFLGWFWFPEILPTREALMSLINRSIFTGWVEKSWKEILFEEILETLSGENDAKSGENNAKVLNSINSRITVMSDNSNESSEETNFDPFKRSRFKREINNSSFEKINGPIVQQKGQMDSIFGNFLHFWEIRMEKSF